MLTKAIFLSYTADLSMFHEVCRKDFFLKAGVDRQLIEKTVIDFVRDNSCISRVSLFGNIDEKAWGKVKKERDIFLSRDVEALAQSRRKIDCLGFDLLRWCYFYETLSSDLKYWIKFLKSVVKENRHLAVVLYLTSLSLKATDNFLLDTKRILASLREIGISKVGVFALPKFFLKEKLSLDKKDYWELVVNMVKIAREFPELYCDFPIGGTIYKRFEEECPGYRFMININCDGGITPCRFCSSKIGKVDKNQVIYVMPVKMLNFKKNSARGCLGNKESLEGRDFYDLLLKK